MSRRGLSLVVCCFCTVFSVSLDGFLLVLSVVFRLFLEFALSNLFGFLPEFCLSYPVFVSPGSPHPTSPGLASLPLSSSCNRFFIGFSGLFRHAFVAWIYWFFLY